jgi:hypothetical protein
MGEDVAEADMRGSSDMEVDFPTALVGFGLGDLVMEESDLRWPKGRLGVGLAC